MNDEGRGQEKREGKREGVHVMGWMKPPNCEYEGTVAPTLVSCHFTVSFFSVGGPEGREARPENKARP